MAKLEKPALKESVESEIDSIIASWGVNENLIKEDKSLPLRSIEVKDKENSRKGISWLVVYGEKDSLHKEFKNEEEAKKFAKENNGKLMPIRTTEVKESLNLTEEGDLDRLLDSDEFKTPVSEEEINAARREVAKESLKEEKEDESGDEESKEVEIEEQEFSEDDIDELDECSLNKHIDEYLKEVYSNVKSYETTDCELKEGKLIVEGKISFNSGKEKLTMFEFLPAYRKGKLFFEGYNKDFSEDKAFTLNCSINKSKTLITESFGYKYKINKNLVKGLK